MDFGKLGALKLLELKAAYSTPYAILLLKRVLELFLVWICELL